MKFRSPRIRSPQLHGAWSVRLSGWLLAATLVLPSVIGWMPMKAHARLPVVASGPVSAQEATARLLADLSVLCTPYGLRLIGQDGKPGKPAGKIAHDICVLCGIAAGASVGVLQPETTLYLPSQTGRIASDPLWLETARWSVPHRPPVRGPPN